MSTTITSLLHANKAILSQKRSLLRAILSRSGQNFNSATDMFSRQCPIIKASIGQHYRHSMDHLELSVLLAFSSIQKNMNNYHGGSTICKCPDSESSVGRGSSSVFSKRENLFVGPFTKETETLHYDLRVRGGTLEKSLDETMERIESVIKILNEIEESVMNMNEDKVLLFSNHAVKASFILSSDNAQEVHLKSTVGRELGFAAHHAIHHMAMVKVIFLQSLGFAESDLPSEFGMAPSTSHFEQNHR